MKERNDAMHTLNIYFQIFIIYSILGWILEVICKLISHKKFINRGFLIGPYCPIYGTGVLFIEILLAKYKTDPFTLFIMIILVCSILEYFTSYILEKLFSTRWWDYSTYKFNINGRICLETMIPFGFLGMLIIYKITPFFLSIINTIPNFWLTILNIFLLIIIITDCIISFKIINNIKKVSKDTQKRQRFKKDDTEKITKLVKKRIENSKKRFQKRIIKAYPHLKFLKRKNK